MLANALASERGRPKKGPKCTACTLLETLATEDSAALAAALADPSFSTAAIARALRVEGYAVSAQTLGRHRKKECSGP